MNANETFHEPYVVIDDNMIKVCGECFPGEGIFSLFPDFRQLSVKISHGICPRHKIQFMLRLAEMAEQRAVK